MKMGLGLNLGQRSAPPAAVANQSAAMGALTLSNSANGYQIVDVFGEPVTTCTDAETGTATGFTLSTGGLIYPSSGGSLSAQDGATIDIECDQGTATITLDVLADSYSVGTGQLAAVLALGSATVDGKTVLGRPGADIGGATIGDTVQFANTLAFTTGFTVTSHDPTEPCFIRRMQFRHDGPVEFDGIIQRDSYRLADTWGSAGLTIFSNNASGRSGVTFTDCEQFSDDLEDYDNSIIVQGTEEAGTSGTTVTLAGSPDLSGVAGDRSCGILIGSSFRTIVGVDDTAKTITIDISHTGTDQDYVIALLPQSLKLVHMDGGITNDPDFVQTGCDCHSFLYGVNGTYNSFDQQWNSFTGAYADLTGLAQRGSETLVRVSNNIFGAPYGLPSDPFNPHVDCIQHNGALMTETNTTAWEFIGNIGWGKDGVAKDLQFVFSNNIGSGVRMLMTVENNIYLGRSLHFITIDRLAAGSSIRGNTGLFDAAATGPSGFVPAISTVTGDYPTGDEAGVIVAYNAVPSISVVNADAHDNYLFGSSEGANEPADYAAVFAGTLFDSDSIADVAALKAEVTPDTTALWPTGRVRMGAMSGYYDYSTGVSDNPWDEDGFDADVDWGDLTEVEVDDAVVSNKIEVTTVSATGVAIRVTGGRTPTLTLYDTDGTTVIVSGVASVCALTGQEVEIHDTASGDGETALAVTITAGAGTVGTWTHETASGFAPQSTAFNGSTSKLQGTPSFSGSAEGTVAFWVYDSQATWATPTGADIFNLRNSGTTNMRVNQATTGLLLLTLAGATGSIVGSFSRGRWHHVLWSYKSGGGGWNKISKDGAAPTDGTDLTSATLGINGSQNQAFICTNNGSVAMFTGDMGYLYINLATAIDITVQANREKFILAGDPVFLGANGELPTGVTPAFYFDGGASMVNLGSAGSVAATALAAGAAPALP